MKRAKHIKMTERGYKKEFRKRFKKLKKALDEFRPGCAFLPKEAYFHIREIERHFDIGYEECKDWWRKA